MAALNKWETEFEYSNRIRSYIKVQDSECRHSSKDPQDHQCLAIGQSCKKNASGMVLPVDGKHALIWITTFECRHYDVNFKSKAKLR